MNEGGRRLRTRNSRRWSNCLLQFLAVVPDEEHFGFCEWPMDANAGQQMFTRSAEGLYVFGHSHTLIVPPRYDFGPSF